MNVMKELKKKTMIDSWKSNLTFLNHKQNTSGILYHIIIGGTGRRKSPILYPLDKLKKIDGKIKNRGSSIGCLQVGQKHEGLRRAA